MKKVIHRLGQWRKSLGVSLFVLFLFPLQAVAQSRADGPRADGARAVNALLNFATRVDEQDRNRSREPFTLPDQASPVAHAVLSAIAQTAGSPETINQGQRAQAIHEAMSEVIRPDEIASQVLEEKRAFRSDDERAGKITKEIAKAIEEKFSTHSDFKLASREERKELKEQEREQKFEEKYGDTQQDQRASLLISQIINFNDGKVGKSKELELLAFSKAGRFGDNKEAKVAAKAEAEADKVATKTETKTEESAAKEAEKDKKSK